MDKVEIIFFIFGLILTVGAGVFFYVLLYQPPPAAFEKQKTMTIDVAGEALEIHYQIAGRGRPVLLIHGLGASLHCWYELTPLLSKQYQVIALDLPGFGRSSKHTHWNYGLDHQAERIEKFLDQLGVKTCAVIGNSMGGNLSLWLARRNPERFTDIVAIAPAANPKLVPWFANKVGFLSRPASWMFAKKIAEWMHRSTLALPNRLSEQHVLQTLNVYRKNPAAVRTFLAATAAIKDPRILTETYDSRILLLWGAKDRLVHRWAIDELLPRLPNAKLVVHPKGGHQLQEDDPEWVYNQVRKFLS